MPIVHLREKLQFDTQRFAPVFLHQGAGAKAVLVCLSDGQAIPPHPESNAAFFYVIEGKGVFSTPEGELAAEAGDWIHVPHGGVRGMRAEGSRIAVLAHAVG